MFSQGQKNVLSTFLPIYIKAKDKKQTAHTIFSTLKNYVLAFATSNGATEESWQKAVKKYYENCLMEQRNKNKNTATVSVSRTTATTLALSTQEKLTWLKLRHIIKYF
ncbi:hypothetical protein MPER_06935 [Moniliophthora perniciosa FA553]|nr:hypothetical protein MPER_06935 [Moniliophthora perniciosa FA553]